MSGCAGKKDLLKTVSLPEKLFRLASGKCVRLRTLRPSMRAALKDLPPDRKIVLTLATVLAEPELTEEEALQFLDGDPFSALAVYAEAGRMARWQDHRYMEKEYECENEAFLKVTGAIARATRRKNE